MKWIKRAWDFIAIKERFYKTFFVMDGGKRVIHKKRLAWTLIITVCCGAGSAFFFGGQADTSFLKKSERPLSNSENGSDSAPKSANGAAPTSGTVGKMFRNSEARAQASAPRPPRGPGMKVNFKAQQVLVSEGAFDPARTLPMGTNLIGKTLTTIDTRFSDQLVKVLLPYGGRAKSGGELPKNSILFGQISYNGKGEKVSIKFSKGIFPSGEEFQVEAQALNPGDYSPGVAGHFHGNADMRIASTLGLTMVAGMSDVLTEKESIGGSALQSGAVTPKSNMKNAMYHGFSQVAQSEANRQAEAIGGEEEYVSVSAGTDLIVSLTKAYIEK